MLKDRFLPPMEVRSILGSLAVRPCTASGATPALTPAVPFSLPGCYPVRTAFASDSDAPAQAAQHWREAIHLRPYQTFDLIIPLPDRTLVPHVSTEPARLTIIGQITATSTPQQTTNRLTTTEEYAYPSPPRSDQTSINPTTEAPP